MLQQNAFRRLEPEMLNCSYVVALVAAGRDRGARELSSQRRAGRDCPPPAAWSLVRAALK
eukprot:scaffold261258_cov48-Prasinocladus_malaysianus.AAC.1